MISFISNLVLWMIIPFILFALFIFSWVIAKKAKTSELKVSSRAGLWAGLIIFVIYLLSNLNRVHEPNFSFQSLPGLLIMPMSLGFIIGFSFLWLVRSMTPTRLVGIITLLLSAISTSALFTYFFIIDLRIWILYLTLGSALGILLHIVFFPASVKEIFE